MEAEAYHDGFYTKLLNTPWGLDTIRFIMDKLTKCAHIIMIQERSLAEKLDEIYMREVITCHGVPILVIL